MERGLAAAIKIQPEGFSRVNSSLLTLRSRKRAYANTVSICLRLCGVE